MQDFVFPILFKYTFLVPLVLGLFAGGLKKAPYAIGVTQIFGIGVCMLFAVRQIYLESLYHNVPIGECRWFFGEKQCLTQVMIDDSVEHPGTMGGYGPTVEWFGYIACCFYCSLYYLIEILVFSLRQTNPISQKA